MNKTIARITAVMDAVGAVGKNQRNESQKFNFRGIDAVVNAVSPALREQGLVIVPRVISADYDLLPSASGGTLKTARLIVEYTVHSPDGEPVVGLVASEAFDSGDKATAKALSVAYRSFMLQLLCIPTDEPDPDEATYNIGQKQAPIASQPGKDWLAAANATKTLAELQTVYHEASAAGVSETMLAAIKKVPRT